MREPRATRPVWLIRHAQSEWNAVGRWQGQRDPALSERGRVQAQALATSLAGAGIQAIVASDLARARETAAIVGRAIAAPVQLDERLRERDLGHWSGLTSIQIAARWPVDLARLRSRDPDLQPGGGESLRALHARVGAFVAALMRAPGDGAIALVTHAGVLRALGLAPAPGNAAARSATIGALHAALRGDAALFAGTPSPLRAEEERL
jgi:probable phosphoglycerate mutase